MLNSLDREEVEELLWNPHWWLQEKHDGQRRLIQKRGNEIIGINRRGLQVDLPQPWIEDCLRCPTDFLLDGEAVGDILHVFDLLMYEGKDVRSRPYLERHLFLLRLLSMWGSRFARIVKTACVDSEKRKSFPALEDGGAEGVVFRKIEEPYTSGRPASDGPALKFKFVESASFVVTRHNEKRSVGLALLSQNRSVEVGNVTIPQHHQIPGIGTVVEVQYLYAFEASNRIYQPVYAGPRADVEQHECTLDQLKYKTLTAEEMVA